MLSPLLRTEVRRLPCRHARMRILVAGIGTVEPALGLELESGGHLIQRLVPANAAGILALEDTFDALVVRLQSPAGTSQDESLQLLVELRQRGLAVPILAVCSQNVHTMTGSLDCGADEFIVYPPRSDELQARLTVAQRRARGRPSSVMVHGDVRLDRNACLVTVAGRPVPLQAREFMLLAHMLEHRGQLRSRTQLQEKLYEQDRDIDSNAIEVHVHNLRRKLGKELIRTVHGQGYVIDDFS